MAGEGAGCGLQPGGWVASSPPLAPRSPELAGWRGDRDLCDGPGASPGTRLVARGAVPAPVREGS